MLSSCWAVLKTTGSSAGIQTPERYMALIAAAVWPLSRLGSLLGLNGDAVKFKCILSLISGNLRASNNKPVVFWCPVVPQESGSAFNSIVWWENYCLLCDGRELEGSAAKHSWQGRDSSVLCGAFPSKDFGLWAALIGHKMVLVWCDWWGISGENIEIFYYCE